MRVSVTEAKNRLTELLTISAITFTEVAIKANVGKLPPDSAQQLS